MKAILLSCLLLACQAQASENELRCLTEALYHEARGEPNTGIFWVGYIIINRVQDARWPDTICGVTHQPGQFSYYHDGKSDRMPYLSRYPEVVQIAKIVYHSRGYDHSHFGYYYKRTDVKHPFFRKLKPLYIIGRHEFYQDRESRI